MAQAGHHVVILSFAAPKQNPQFAEPYRASRRAGGPPHREFSDRLG